MRARFHVRPLMRVRGAWHRGETTNRLAHSTSPYLLQHAQDPVDWCEFEPATFTEARSRDVPVLLSVGYAA